MGSELSRGKKLNLQRAESEVVVVEFTRRKVIWKARIISLLLASYNWFSGESETEHLSIIHGTKGFHGSLLQSPSYELALGRAERWKDK